MRSSLASTTARLTSARQSLVVDSENDRPPPCSYGEATLLTPSTLDSTLEIAVVGSVPDGGRTVIVIERISPSCFARSPSLPTPRILPLPSTSRRSQVWLISVRM